MHRMNIIMTFTQADLFFCIKLCSFSSNVISTKVYTFEFYEPKNKNENRRKETQSIKGYVGTSTYIEFSSAIMMLVCFHFNFYSARVFFLLFYWRIYRLLWQYGEFILKEDVGRYSVIMCLKICLYGFVEKYKVMFLENYSSLGQFHVREENIRGIIFELSESNL